MTALANSGEVDILLVDVNPSFPPVPPLGLEVLASALAEEGFRAEIVSASPFLPDYSQCLEGLRQFRPRAVGLQIRNYDQALLREGYPTMHSFHKSTRRMLGQMFPAAPLILGGTGFSIDPQFWLRELTADFGIVGSGEMPLALLLGSLSGCEDTAKDISGVVVAGQPPKPTWLPRRLSRVRRDRLDYGRWQQSPAGGIPWANVETHRGCRFRCDFCVEPRIHGQEVVFKDPVDVVAELRELMVQGIIRCFFCSSEFNLDPSYALELCRSVFAAGLGERLRWWTYAIPDRLSPELCRAMALAGCESISFNAVHIDDGILASFRCPHRRANYERCLDAAEGAGLEVSSTFLLGSCLETDETVAELVSFIDGRMIRANISLGLAHYPVLLPSAAMKVTPETRLFPQAGNGTIPYSLRLSPEQVSCVVRWADSRPNVLVQNQEPCLSMHGPCERTGAEYLTWIRQAAGVERTPAASAVESLRENIPLLDLPVVRLGSGGATAGAPPEPAFFLYGPYRNLSQFYRELHAFLASPGATPEAVARLYLRLSVCTGEFPRLLEAGSEYLDADATAWLREKWEHEQSFPQLVLASSYGCQSHCPYCYATDVGRDHPGELTLDNFRLALDWAEKQGCRVISFAGGEPTFHQLAREFFEILRLRGLRTYFNSNLLCHPDVIANFSGLWVINIGIHAQAVRHTPREQRANFQRNVGSLRERGVPLFLRYNFERQNEEAIGDALALARELRVGQVNFAVPMPSLSRRNRHVGERDLLACGQFLASVTEAFRADGLTPILTKPVPPCVLPEDKLEFFRANEALAPACNIAKREWTQNVLVAPDLSVSPCVGVATPGPSLLDFHSFEEISRYLISHLRAILRPMPFEQCHTCNFHLDARCLGGCLAYFADGAQTGTGSLAMIESPSAAPVSAVRRLA